MGIMKSLLFHRNGRDQYGIGDEERHDQREDERRAALTPEQREAEERARQNQLAREKVEFENRRKEEQKEDRKKEEKRKASVREFWAQFGVSEEVPEIDPHFSMEHREYLQTPLWAKIRRRILKRDGKACQICGVSAKVVHHHSYDYEVILNFPRFNGQGIKLQG